jgi:hypothetical protein
LRRQLGKALPGSTGYVRGRAGSQLLIFVAGVFGVTGKAERIGVVQLILRGQRAVSAGAGQAAIAVNGIGVKLFLKLKRREGAQGVNVLRILLRRYEVFIDRLPPATVSHQGRAQQPVRFHI